MLINPQHACMSGLQLLFWLCVCQKMVVFAFETGPTQTSNTLSLLKKLFLKIDAIWRKISHRSLEHIVSGHCSMILKGRVPTLTISSQKFSERWTGTLSVQHECSI